MQAIKVNPKDVITYRNHCSVAAGTAGIPLSQLVPTSVMANRALGGDAVDRENLIHDLLQQAVKKGLIVDTMTKLIMDIKAHGVKIAIQGYKLGTKFEVVDGTHRAACACMLGLASIPALAMPIDPFNTVSPKLEAVYKQSAVALGFPGLVYNPLGNRPCRRQGWNRFFMIYEELIGLKGRHLLELGCFDGFFGTVLATRCFDVTFVDKCAPAIDIVKAKMEDLLARKPDPNLPSFMANRPDAKYEYILGDAPAWLEKTDETFDAIICTDAFYHMFAAGQADKADAILGNCLKRLKGKMIFCPGPWPLLNSHGWNEKRMWLVCKKYGKVIRYLGTPVDKQSYERRELYCIS